MQTTCFIAGKMTPVLQITDTDFAYRMKSIAAQVGRELKKEQKAAAVQSPEGEMEMTTWGCRELLEIVHRTLERLVAVERRT